MYVFFCFKAVSIDESDRGTFVASELKTCLITTDDYYCYAEPHTRDFPSPLEVKPKEKQTLFALIPTLQGQGKKIRREERNKKKPPNSAASITALLITRSFPYAVCKNISI